MECHTDDMADDKSHVSLKVPGSCWEGDRCCATWCQYVTSLLHTYMCTVCDMHSVCTYNTPTCSVGNRCKEPRVDEKPVKGQEFLLATGQNYATVPLYLSKGEYVTAVEKVFKIPQVVEELRAETNRVLKCSCPQPNITGEPRALKKLRKDRS